jgi:hypothetical protein
MEKNPMHRSPVYPLAIFAFAFCAVFVLCVTLGLSHSPIAQAQMSSGDSATNSPASPDASTALKVTVGTISGVCAPTNNITVSMGATIYYCYFLENKSNHTLTVHSLLDDAYPAPLYDRLLLTITSKNGAAPAQEILGIATVERPIHSTVTWIATSTTGLSFTAQSSVHINMPTLAVTATVGVDPELCSTEAEIAVPSGTQVYYCYQVHNSGAMTLTIDRITGFDTRSGASLPFVLAPAARVNLTASALITQTTDQTISLTGYTKTGLTAYARGQTTVRVPALQVTTTADLAGAPCAATNSLTVSAGSKVFYCYKLTNTGGVPLIHHRVLGSTIARGARELTFTLAVTADVSFPTPLVITETGVHTVTWIAWNGNLTATARTLVTTTALTTLTVEAYYDVNGARNREAREPALANIQLTLAYPNGISLTKMSDISGTIVFTNIPARVYTATVTNFNRDPYTPLSGTAVQQLDLRGRPATHAPLAFTLPPDTDTDKDGIPNWQEGAGDEDGDGIPNYLDYSPKVFIVVIRRAE